MVRTLKKKDIAVQKKNITSDQRLFSIRFKWLFLLMLPLFALFVVLNLFVIQVNNGSYFREQADNQYIVASYNAFERGSIYFTDKLGTLTTAAGNKNGYKITIDPSKTKELDMVFDVINPYYSLGTKENFISNISPIASYYEVANEIDVDTAKKIKKELGSRVQIYSEKWRVYPLGSVASHLLGLMGYKGDEYAGRYGLERYYESTLKRTSADIYTNLFAKIFHGVKNLNKDDLAKEADIVTSIEPQVQMFLESTVKGIQETWRSERTGAIIMDARTGEIVGMSATPDFDPNDLSGSTVDEFKNPLVENVYEMGSVIKPLVVAMALDSKVIKEQSTYNDLGSVAVGNRIVYNFDKKGRGLVTIQDILNQSLNTGMVYISKQIPKEKFRNYFEAYGFAKKTNIDLPNEVAGITGNLKSNRDVEFANMSFGQGIAMSPLSMITASSALANKGIRLQPHVVKKFIYRNGISKDVEYPVSNRVISEASAQQISKMLVNVFDSYGDGKSKIPNYTVAGKTGTAQIPSPNGGYYQGRNLHSFIGYFPAYESRYIIFLYTVYPKEIKYSSQTLLNPFKSTVEFLINYYNVPPDR